MAPVSGERQQQQQQQQHAKMCKIAVSARLGEKFGHFWGSGSCSIEIVN